MEYGYGWGMEMQNPMNFSYARPMFQPQQPHFPPPWMSRPPNPWPMHTGNGNRGGYVKKNNNTRQRKEPVFVAFCDVCDRGFKNIAKKEEHFREHIKCGEPGCNFEAHFKIVSIHKQNLHGNNSRKMKLDTPEEIEKWRNERKRKYPTILNVELKAKLAKEQKAHGNFLQNKKFGKMKQRKNMSNLNPGQTNKVVAKNFDEKKCTSTPLNLLFSGESTLPGNNASSDEGDSDSKVTGVKAQISVGLGSLMQSYASDSEEEEAPTNSELSKKVEGDTIAALKHNDITKKSDATLLEESNLNTNELISSENISNYKSKSSSQFDRSSGRNKKKGNHTNIVKKQKPTLLEMLLAPEIRRERNHILQCVRYIVQNNFFDNNESSST